MSAIATSQSEFRDAVEAAARELVVLKHFGETTFINLPLLYPDGSAVTLKIDPMPNGVRVSDNGFAYREIEGIGAEASFPKSAQKVAEEIGVLANRRAIYADARMDGLFRAICDVAAATWRVADIVYRRTPDRMEAEIEANLRVRLGHVFGQDRVRPTHKVRGLSVEWDVSAIVLVGGHEAVFQAVGGHANSVYRASSAFHDLSIRENPPRLVAVVRDKLVLGPKLGLLAQVGNVIEDRQPDDVFARAAA